MIRRMAWVSALVLAGCGSNDGSGSTATSTSGGDGGAPATSSSSQGGSGGGGGSTSSTGAMGGGSSTDSTSSTSSTSSTGATGGGGSSSSSSSSSSSTGVACTDPGASMLCGGTCVDPKSDLRNCGQCDTRCSQCNDGVCTACPVLDVFLSLDDSGFLAAWFGANDDRWSAIRDGLTSFFAEPASAGMGVGLSYYPRFLPVGPCTQNSDCPEVGDICFEGKCEVSTVRDSCAPSDYVSPDIEIAALPGNTSALETSLNATEPQGPGKTPQLPALDGALTHAKAWAAANPTHTVVLLMIADTLSDDCYSNGYDNILPDTVQLVSGYLAGTPSVKTYVLGISDQVPAAAWDQIAAAGGTTASRVALVPSAVLPYLEAIRDEAYACP